MRDITRRHLRILNNENWMPIILMDIRLAGTSVESTIRLTNAGELVTWDGNDYSVVNMARGLLEEIVVTDTGNQPSLTIQISNIDLQMATLLSSVCLDDAEVTVRVCDRRLLTRARDRLELTTGRLRQPQLTGDSLLFQVINIIGQCDDTTIPNRLWKPECSLTYGSPACGVVLNDEPNTIITSVLSGTSIQYVVVGASVLSTAGSPADPNDFWNNGYLVFQDGICAASARSFQRYQLVGSEHRFYVKVPWLKTPSIGNTVLIRRGCGKIKADCLERQGNYLNYGGFVEVPYGAINPAIIGGLDDVNQIWSS